jgi:hypothetical protein
MDIAVQKMITMYQSECMATPATLCCVGLFQGGSLLRSGLVVLADMA